MNTELSPKVFWGVAAAVVVVGGGIVFGVIRRSDPAAQGPIPYKPFDRSKYAAQMAPPPNPFAGRNSSQEAAGH